jgi:hypothetical protein
VNNFKAGWRKIREFSIITVYVENF